MERSWTRGLKGERIKFRRALGHGNSTSPLLADVRCGDPPASGRSMTAAQQRTDPGREELAITSPTGTSGFSCALGGSVVMPCSVGDSAPCL